MQGLVWNAFLQCRLLGLFTENHFLQIDLHPGSHHHKVPKNGLPLNVQEFPLWIPVELASVWEYAGSMLGAGEAPLQNVILPVKQSSGLTRGLQIKFGGTQADPPVVSIDPVLDGRQAFTVF